MALLKTPEAEETLKGLTIIALTSVGLGVVVWALSKRAEAEPVEVEPVEEAMIHYARIYVHADAWGTPSIYGANVSATNVLTGEVTSCLSECALPLVPGTYDMTASADGYRPQTQNVIVTRSMDVRFYLIPFECLSGETKCAGTSDPYHPGNLYACSPDKYWYLAEQDSPGCIAAYLGGCAAGQAGLCLNKRGMTGQPDSYDAWECENGVWVRKEVDSSMCGYPVCTPGDTKCEGTDKYTCKEGTHLGFFSWFLTETNSLDCGGVPIPSGNIRIYGKCVDSAGVPITSERVWLTDIYNSGIKIVDVDSNGDYVMDVEITEGVYYNLVTQGGGPPGNIHCPVKIKKLVFTVGGVYNYDFIISTVSHSWECMW